MFIQNSNQWLVYLFYYATGLVTPGDLGVYSLVDRVREFAKWRAKMKTGNGVHTILTLKKIKN